MNIEQRILRLAKRAKVRLAKYEQYIKAKTPEERKLVLAENITWLVNIDNPSEEDVLTLEEARELLSTEALQLAATKHCGWALHFVSNPSERVQLIVVGKYGYAIRYIPEPSEAVQLAAVKQDGLAIKGIDNPSEAVQLAAVKQNEDAVRYISKPHEAVIKYLE